MSCCKEHGCKRSKPFKIRLTPFSQRWVLITDYTTRGDQGQYLTAKYKHDIHDELLAALTDAGWTPPSRALRPVDLPEQEVREP